MAFKKGFLLLFLWLASALAALGQDSFFVLKPSMVAENGYLGLPDIDQWKFKEGNDPNWADPSLDDRNWKHLDSASIAALSYGEDGRFEGWFRFKFKFEKGFKEHPYFFVSFNTAAQEIFLDGEKVLTFGSTGNDSHPFQKNIRQYKYLSLEEGRVYSLAVHFVDEIGPLTLALMDVQVLGPDNFLAFNTADRVAAFNSNIQPRRERAKITFLFCAVLSFLFWLTWVLIQREKHLLLIAVIQTLITIYPMVEWLSLIELNSTYMNREWYGIRALLYNLNGAGLCATASLLMASLVLDRIPKWIKQFSLLVITILLPAVLIATLLRLNQISQVIISAAVISSGAICLYLVVRYWRNIRGAKWIVIGTAFLVFALVEIIAFFVNFSVQVGLVSQGPESNALGIYRLGQTFLFPASLLVYVAFWLRETIMGERQKARELVRVTREKEHLLKEQNIRLEKEVNERTAELKNSLEDLKAAQDHLIHSEKMASLGELTAGIAHEIKNPLNFINNFSELNAELLAELEEEISKENLEEVKQLAKDIAENEQKITHHGKRADSIVKGMLQHSRSGNGKKEPTDLNALADEYFRLAYHGLRAKDKSFNAAMETDFDDSIGKVSVVSQDIGRVLLNLITNAFHAVSERRQKETDGYQPTVWVQTRKTADGVEITVRDNGGGIPDSIREKIFQPFFTTKPTGEGTGLGLSLSYDIVTKGHGGTLEVATEPGKGSKFTVKI